MTGNDNIADLESATSELTKIVKANSLAFQVCGIQYSKTPTPLIFGVKKATATTGFEIIKKTPEKTTLISDEGFTEEVIDDVYALFGENANEYLRTIAANSMIDELDAEVVTYMRGIATVDTAYTLNFTTSTDHRELIHNLILKINKTRVEMADELKRGMPKILIVSGEVAAILISNKIVSGNDSDYVSSGKENIKFVGKMGDMMVYHDFNIATASILIAHKNYTPSDASVIIVPISETKMATRIDKESGQPHFHFNQRFAYSRNPLDEIGANDSTFVRSIALTLTGFADI